MREATLFLTLIIFSISINSQDIEFENSVEDIQFNVINGISPIRSINGGTVICVDYTDECSLQLRGAFDYACKLLEEYLPTCLPIRVNVEVKDLKSKSKNPVLSKVSFSSINKHSEEPDSLNFHPMTKVKYVLLNESVSTGGGTFNNHFNRDCSSLINFPDITITYNSKMLDEFSYSLKEDTNDKYDFITVALRDLLRGFGIYNDFTYDRYNINDLYHSDTPLTDFEELTNKYLGNGSPSERFANATTGELFFDNIGIKLYAPQKWDDEKSLKYFIPNSRYHVSQVLSHEFGRGCVYRNINDSHHLRIFRDLLNWRVNFVTGGGTSSMGDHTGSTAELFPYNGSLTIATNDSTYQSVSIPTNSLRLKSNTEDEIYLMEYINKFHPGISMTGNIKQNIATFSILRTDGTWDVVYETPYFHYDDYSPEITFNMNDFEFHESIGAKYDRTCDGNLRTRITMVYIDYDIYGPHTYFKSKYYVMDYTPQQLEIDYEIKNSSDTYSLNASTSSSLDISIGLKNVEGLNKVVLEKRINNARLPVKIEVENFKDGVYNTTCPSFGTTSFVAVGYNKNGSSRSEPIVITPSSSATLDSKFIKYSDNKLIIDKNIAQCLQFINYIIMPFDAKNTVVTRGLLKDNNIDVSNLPNGIYLLQLVGKGAPINAIKFVRN